MFPLRLCSYYSLMRATQSPEELCRRVKEKGYTGAALTDRDNLYGLWPFLAACRRHRLKPIVGCQLSDPHGDAVVVCLVKNKAGYANLCRLISARKRDASFSLQEGLACYGDGLLLLCRDRGLLAWLHDRKRDVAADLGPRPTQEGATLRRWAAGKGVRCVATPDGVIGGSEDGTLLALLRAIDGNLRLSDALDLPECANPEPLHETDVYNERFAVWPEVVSASNILAEKCTFHGPDRRLVMPPWPGQVSAAATLRQKAYEGARRRYGLDLGEAVVERLEHELQTIDSMGFSSYFLVVRDIVHRPEKGGGRRRRRICGRGSGAASLVAYCLEITNVCPMKYNLYFERFLNPGRSDPPDIDIDFAWDERDEVLHQVLADHGDHAAMVCNHIFFKPRMAIRETAKACGMPGPEISRITSRLPWFSGRGEDMFSRLRRMPGLRGQNLAAPWPEIIGRAAELVGIPRYISVHPGGVVITPQPIATYVPVENAPKGVPVIQWEKDGTEEAGLIKIDLLGNRSLGVIRDCLANVRRRGVSFSEKSWEPEDDPATRKTVAAGSTMGCFYIESPAMRLLQKKANTGDYEQLVLQSSIIRPAANEFVREYVRRLHGGSWQPLHPQLGDVLDDTFGLMVYQEDVSRVAVHLAGFSHARADGLRKVMSKKDKHNRLADYRQEFYRGCRKKGLDTAAIDGIWAMMMSFDGYSFCKPHSASYARVSFQAAYLKTHYPAEFMAAVISNQGGYYSTFAYVSEAKRCGVRVLPPDVNRSGRNWTSENGAIRVGLQSVRAVSHDCIERLCAVRQKQGPFSSSADFLHRVRPAEDEGRQLIHSGALDSIEQNTNRSELLWNLARFHRILSSSRRMPLFQVTLPSPPRLAKPAKEEELRREYRALGFLCATHPVIFYRHMVQDRVISSSLPRYTGRRVSFLGWLLTGKLVSTKTGEAMEFLTFEDEYGMVETTFFPRVYDRYAGILSSGKPYHLVGLVETDYGAITLTVESVKSLEKVR